MILLLWQFSRHGKSGFWKPSSNIPLKQIGRFVYFGMSNSQQTDRIIAQMTGVNSQRLRSGRLGDSEWPLITHAVEQVEAMKLFMDDASFLSFPSLRAKCIQWQSLGSWIWW